jgi:hypothetical protein
LLSSKLGDELAMVLGNGVSSNVDVVENLSIPNTRHVTKSVYWVRHTPALEELHVGILSV